MEKEKQETKLNVDDFVNTNHIQKKFLEDDDEENEENEENQDSENEDDFEN